MDSVDACTVLAVADARSGASALVSGTQSTVLCCECGIPMVWNPSSMCSNCIRVQVDISEGIPKNVSLQMCKGCGRYLNPPKHWVACQLESKELLSVCIKKIKGLNKIKLVDASFIWTEPHSKRLKVKLTIQKEVFSGVILQQAFAVEFVVHSFQCPNCTMVAADNTWTAVVQVRQKVDHKRTFYLLEQLILKHKAHQQTTNVKEVPDGIDFYFLHRHHAIKFQDFVTTVIPCRAKGASEKVLSEDLNNNCVSAKYTFSVEVVPVCKDDVLCLHPRQHAANGNLGPLVLCTGITQSLRIIDPVTMQCGELRADPFFKNPRAALLSGRQATEYTVLDVEPTGLQAGKFAQAEVTVARTRDLGSNDEQFRTLTHLGHLLQAGDTVLGYDMTSAVFNEAETKEWPRLQPPEIILFKKLPGERRKKERVWKLRSLIKEEEEGTYKSLHRQTIEEYERFLEDVEGDAELRQRVNVYKDPAHFRLDDAGQLVPPQRSGGAGGRAEGAEEGSDRGAEEGGDEAGPALEEMLDDLVLGEDVQEPVGEGLGGDEEDPDDDADGERPSPPKGAGRPAR